jgi:uncharacterized protein DUF5330
MRFLFKVAFWLSVVVLLLPTAPSERPAATPQIGATEAVSAASAAVSDVRQFCSRQAEACAIGSQAISQFGHKAEAGAKMLYEFLNERFGERVGAVVANGADKPAAASIGKPSQNTLTPADIAPAWRGPSRRDADAKRPA